MECISEYFRFYNTVETLSKIENFIANKQKGAYLRFGDGDVNLATGGEDAYQRSRSKLKIELQEALALNDLGVMRCLPLMCKELGGWEEGMYPGNFEVSHQWCINLLKRLEPINGANITDVYSPAALAFAATNHTKKCIDFLSFLQAQPCYLLVGNKNVPQPIRDLLFGSNRNFVPVPANDSYDEIDRIEHQCLEHLNKQSGYNVIITAMGCSGRVLQKRLWYKCENIFLFDFGSLMDGLCGWNTRAWIDLAKFNSSEFLQLLTERQTK